MIISKGKSAQIIVSGDLKQEYAEFSRRLEPLGLKGLISEGIPTHQKGGSLDQILTNLQCQEIWLGECENSLTDHKAIYASLIVRPNDPPVPPTTTTLKLSQRKIRELANS
jgi:hypothetical protein